MMVKEKEEVNLQNDSSKYNEEGANNKYVR
jgi:hypothetical protein